jgi:hypothetical protein
MKSLARTISGLALGTLLAASAYAAESADKYQVTGPVLEVTDTMIAVQKGKDRWEVARDAGTKVTGDLKVGSKVTIKYRSSTGWSRRRSTSRRPTPRRRRPRRRPRSKTPRSGVSRGGRASARPFSFQSFSRGDVPVIGRGKEPVAVMGTSGCDSTWYPASSHPSMPPASGRTIVNPRSIKRRATRAAEASLGHVQ